VHATAIRIVGIYRLVRRVRCVPTARVSGPSRPDVSPVSDTSVLVRWTVVPPSGSLNIVTFKLQYRDVLERTSTVGWQTVDDDIPASQRAFEVTRLTPGIDLFMNLCIYWAHSMGS